jgi:5-methylcytosine-specific restriction endonuclease McrA
MPFKDPDYNRAYQRQLATKRREEKRLLLANDPTANPLLIIGGRWVCKWVKQGEQLLASHSDEANEARLHKKRARVRRYREKNPALARARTAAYYQLHREEERAKARARYAEIREAENARSRAYYAENTEAIAAQKSSYHRENAEYLRVKHEEWCAKNPERIVGYSATRRARKANAPIDDLTPAQWKEIKAAYGYRCVYCPPDCKACHKKTHKLTQEHITPFSKGGSNTAPNVVPACQPCNSRKHDKAPLNPVQPLLLTIASSRKHKAG